MTDEIIKFKCIPLCERYYDDNSSFGVYNFKTTEEIEGTKSFSDPLERIFGEPSKEYEKEYHGVLSGKMQRLTLNLEYECEGILEYNKKYNNYQYKPLKIFTKKPVTIEEQQIFLRTIVTERQANILLEVYPNIVQDIIDNKEVDLSKTNGIKEFTFNTIREKVLENFVMADILVLLAPLGVTINKIKKLSEHEPNPILLKEMILNDPYILTEIDGLGFKSVDDIAVKLNPNFKVSKERVIGFIKYTLEDIANSIGHTWIPIRDLSNAIASNLNECKEIYNEIIDNIKEKYQNGRIDKLIYINNDKIGLKRFFNIEKEILDKIVALNNSPSLINGINIEEAIDNTENKLGFKLTEEQKNAVRSIKDNNVIIITASAGAGKTTVVNAIIEAYKGKADIALCALSAKASQRIKEVTGENASTIHRLLGFSKGEFAHNDNNPLKQQLVVLDEASMVNSSIFLHLVRALRLGCKFVIVFDFAQLPPIGAGNVATDLLNGNVVKVNKFTKVHRQAEKSGILMDANKIREQINPLDKPENIIVHGELKDMIYKFRDSRELIHDLAIKAYMSALKDTNIDDLILITPRKDDCINSAREFNSKIQELVLSDEKRLIKRGNKIFKLGARVIQRKNNYDKDVLNGEMGFVSKIISPREFLVEFKDGKVIEFSDKEMDDMELAYALTLHSTQGSQWHTIICVIDFNSYILLDKCLLYTGITRAEKRCMLIAEPKAFKYSVDTDKSITRQTFLRDMCLNYSLYYK